MQFQKHSKVVRCYGPQSSYFEHAPSIQSNSSNKIIFSEERELQESIPVCQQETHKNIVNLNDQLVNQALSQTDHHTALSLLHQLTQCIKNRQKSLNKLESECRQTQKQYFYQLYVCYFNQAVVYQRTERSHETSKFFEKAIKNLEQIRGFITNREQNVSYSIELAKLYLQYCSILSNISKHSEAITFAEKSLQKFIECFRVLEAICFEFKVAYRLPETNSNSRQGQSKVKTERVNFKGQIINEAEKMLKELTHLPESHELIIKFKSRYESLMYVLTYLRFFRERMFFWKQNSQNNEKLLRKQLSADRQQVASPRNILGLQKSSSAFSESKGNLPSPCSNFNLTIQSLTNLNHKCIVYPHSDFMNLKTADSSLYLLSSRRLTEMAFHVAMVYFTIATEMRFSQQDLSNLNKMKISQKYEKLNKDERILKCKMIHMKGIEIAGKFLPENSDLFTHLLKRFNNNYKCVMEQISEEESRDLFSVTAIQSQKSSFYSHLKQKTYRQEAEEEQCHPKKTVRKKSKSRLRRNELKPPESIRGKQNDQFDEYGIGKDNNGIRQAVSKKGLKKFQNLANTASLRTEDTNNKPFKIKRKNTFSQKSQEHLNRVEKSKNKMSEKEKRHFQKQMPFGSDPYSQNYSKQKTPIKNTDQSYYEETPQKNLKERKKRNISKNIENPSKQRSSTIFKSKAVDQVEQVFRRLVRSKSTAIFRKTYQ